MAQAEILTNTVAPEVQSFITDPALLNQYLFPRLLDAPAVDVRQAPDSFAGTYSVLLPAPNPPPDFMGLGRRHLRHGETIGALPPAVDEYQKVFCHSERAI